MDAIGPYLIFGGSESSCIRDRVDHNELAKLFVKSNDSVKKFNDFHVIDQNSEIDFEIAVVSFFQTTTPS